MGCCLRQEGAARSSCIERACSWRDTRDHTERFMLISAEKSRSPRWRWISSCSQLHSLSPPPSLLDLGFHAKDSPVDRTTPRSGRPFSLACSAVLLCLPPRANLIETRQDLSRPRRLRSIQDVRCAQRRRHAEEAGKRDSLRMLDARVTANAAPLARRHLVSNAPARGAGQALIHQKKKRRKS
jgi:hypothetical protein